MTIDELGELIAFGILSGVLGGSGAGSNALKSQVSRMGKRIANAVAHGSAGTIKKETVNAIKYFMKHGGKKATIDMAKAVMRSSLAPVLETIQDSASEIIEFISNLSEKDLQE